MPTLHTCPICKNRVALADRMIVSASGWRRRGSNRNGNFISWELYAGSSGYACEVWRNTDLDGKPADWHWQHAQLDRCCGTFPSGTAASLASAKREALDSLIAHAARLGCEVEVAP